MIPTHVERITDHNSDAGICILPTDGEIIIHPKSHGWLYMLPTFRERTLHHEIYMLPIYGEIIMYHKSCSGIWMLPSQVGRIIHPKSHRK